MSFTPDQLVRAALFSLMGLLGLVMLILAPWTGLALILTAGGGVAYTLLPWKTWLPKQPQA